MEVDCPCHPDWLYVAVENDGVILLNYSNLTEFPLERLCPRHNKLATTFYVKRNLLQKLPEGLPSYYPSITELYLPSNQIAKLPSSIGDLHQLRNLNISDNQITEFPPSFTRLSNLEKLYARHNSLHALPANIGDLEKLTILDASYNQLRHLPCSIHKCKHLNQLLISHNRLTSLPRHVCLLAELEQLSMSSNQIVFLPIDLGASKGLSVVELENNRSLNSCPSHLFLKHCHYADCAQKQLSNVAAYRYGFHDMLLEHMNPDGVSNKKLSCPQYIMPCRPLVPSLKEMCCHALGSHSFDQDWKVSWQNLPPYVHNRLNFPLGHCYLCAKPMYWSCVAKLKHVVDIAPHRPSLPDPCFMFVSYFCSYSCASKV